MPESYQLHAVILLIDYLSIFSWTDTSTSEVWKLSGSPGGFIPWWLRGPIQSYHRISISGMDPGISKFYSLLEDWELLV